MEKKVGLISLGCPKNLVDSEVMLGLLEKEGYKIINNEKDAQVIIINTCGFIESAKQESIDTILETAKLKEGNCERIIVTGCLAQRYKDEIINEIPDVDAVIGTGSYGEIVQVINSTYNNEKIVLYDKLDDISYLENERIVSTNNGFAYLKIAEGCDNCCTYCIIPVLRGRYRSRSIDDIVLEASTLSEKGVSEIILVAQDVTSFGKDTHKERKLSELIKRISNIPKIEWIRLLYCYPEEIDDILIEEIANNKKVVKYLDIPIQHASNKILKEMGRRGNLEEVKNLIFKLRERIPDIVLRTTFIVGFPGETEEDFSILYDFVKECRFERLGVFEYSKEENTKAYKMRPQVLKKVKKQRQKSIMELQNSISIEKNRQRLNKVYKTIVSGVSEDGIFYYGRTYAETPDIDGVIYFTSPYSLEIGSFVNVKILNAEDYDLVGEVIDESTK